MALNRRGRGAPWLECRRASSRCWRPRGRVWACLGCSWGWSRAPGRERRSGASSRGSLAWAHALAELGGIWRAPHGGQRERERRGTARWHVADVKAPRLARGRGSRWSGDAVSTVGRTLTCSRARKWPTLSAFSRVLTRPLVSGSCKGE